MLYKNGVINTGKNNQFPFWKFYRVFGDFPTKSQICESETIPRITTWEFTIPYIGIYYSQYWKMFQYWEFNCLRLASKIWELPSLHCNCNAIQKTKYSIEGDGHSFKFTKKHCYTYTLV